MTFFDAVLFDLDDTLLDTSSLRSLRDDRDWGALYRNLDAASVFVPSSPGPAVETLPAQVQARGKKATGRVRDFTVVVTRVSESGSAVRYRVTVTRSAPSTAPARSASPPSPVSSSGSSRASATAR